ncbi:hypothetical protein [Algoriphagus boritolerans]|uniref:hypothetical protein n=1 Tax=Algoriphagus boritolerans TaxID=308111 RepID=UPI002FCE40B4
MAKALVLGMVLGFLAWVFGAALWIIGGLLLIGFIGFSWFFLEPFEANENGLSSFYIRK